MKTIGEYAFEYLSARGDDKISHKDDFMLFQIADISGVTERHNATTGIRSERIRSKVKDGLEKSPFFSNVGESPKKWVYVLRPEYIYQKGEIDKQVKAMTRRTISCTLHEAKLIFVEVSKIDTGISYRGSWENQKEMIGDNVVLFWEADSKRVLVKSATLKRAQDLDAYLPAEWHYRRKKSLGTPASS